MELVGHRTEEIYNRYNITSAADKREAARKLDVAASALATVSQQASK